MRPKNGQGSSGEQAGRGKVRVEDLATRAQHHRPAPEPPGRQPEVKSACTTLAYMCLDVPSRLGPAVDAGGTWPIPFSLRCLMPIHSSSATYDGHTSAYARWRLASDRPSNRTGCP